MRYNQYVTEETQILNGSRPGSDVTCVPYTINLITVNYDMSSNPNIANNDFKALTRTMATSKGYALYSCIDIFTDSNN
jgi:hypothetical protein